MANPENLKQPWQPGQSGNPKGKPKGALNLKTVLETLLEEEVDYVKPNGDTIKLPRKTIAMMKWIEAGMQSKDPLKDPDWKATQAFYEQIHGKPLSKNEHTGPDGEPIKLAITPEYIKSLQQTYKELKESEKKDD